MRLAAAVLAIAMLLSSCSQSNNLLMGRVETTVGGHTIVVTDCYRTSAPQPRQVEAAAYHYMPCRDADVWIRGEEGHWWPMRGPDSSDRSWPELLPDCDKVLAFARDPQRAAALLRPVLAETLRQLEALSTQELLRRRHERLRKLATFVDGA